MSQLTLPYALLSVSVDVLSWAAWLIIYQLYRADPTSTETKLPASLATAALVVLFIDAIWALLTYALWEYRFGNAFSYFFPAHGITRINEFTWRFGVYEKTNVVGNLTLLFLRLVCTLDIALTFDGIRLFSPLSPLEILLANIAMIFPLLVVLLFAFAGQFYVRPIEKDSK
jgi:hypothetical protein